MSSSLLQDKFAACSYRMLPRPFTGATALLRRPNIIMRNYLTAPLKIFAFWLALAIIGIAPGTAVAQELTVAGSTTESSFNCEDDGVNFCPGLEFIGTNFGGTTTEGVLDLNQVSNNLGTMRITPPAGGFRRYEGTFQFVVSFATPQGFSPNPPPFPTASISGQIFFSERGGQGGFIFIDFANSPVLVRFDGAGGTGLFAVAVEDICYDAFTGSRCVFEEGAEVVNSGKDFGKLGSVQSISNILGANETFDINLNGTVYLDFNQIPNDQVLDCSVPPPPFSPQQCTVIPTSQISGFYNPACSTNVSNQVTVIRSGFRYIYATRRYQQTLTIRNNGPAINGAVFIALDNLTPNVTLLNRDGLTNCAAPLNSPFRLVIPGGLATGAQTTVVVQFQNPQNRVINYGARVLSSGSPVGSPPS